VKHLVISLLCVAICCFQQDSSAGWLPLAKTAGGGGGYIGPGDAISGAKAFYSCARAYNATYASGAGNLCTIADVGTGATTCTMKAAASGFADLASALCAGGTLTVSAFCTAHTSCVVTKMFDQTGALACGAGLACDISQATLANMPALTFSVLNSLPCVTFAQTSGLAGTSTLTLAQPLTMPVASKRTTAVSNDDIIGPTSRDAEGFYSSAGNAVQIFAGSSSSQVTASDGAFHGLQFVLNGASSAINVDGTSTSGLNGGTNGYGNPVGLGLFHLTGVICEGGIWPSAFSSGNQTTMFNNMNGSNGYNGGL
jgi:hypothetical protein